MTILSATLLVVTVAGASPRTSAVDAPKFVAGPRITKAGLIWLSTRGPMLTGSARVSRRLSGGRVLPVSSPDSKWEAQESRKGVLVGEIGARSSNIAPLHGCPPLRATDTLQQTFAAKPSSLLAISGARLFAIVDPLCLRRHSYGHAAILVEDLETRVWKLLAGIPAGALSLAAAGKRLAITYVSNPATSATAEGETKVVVYDSRTGRRLFRVTAALAARQATPASTAVDDLGDVLVTETIRRPPPSTRASSGWWASPGRPVAHELPTLLTTEPAISSANSADETVPSGAAALSHGRIAYATAGESGESLEVLDLHTGRTRTVVRLQGETGLLGLDLAGDELAWAQQDTVLVGGIGESVGGGSGRFSTCQTVPLGDALLMSIRLRSLPAPGITIDKPRPTVTPPCAPRL
jgi:hypothetical protein